jgi:hypothetical protein
MASACDQHQSEGSVEPVQMTGLPRLTACVVIRPRKMTNGLKIGPVSRGAAQNAVTNWCQSRVGCDKKLCLHYESHEIHDFGLKSCSSWIYSSQIAPHARANGWSNNTLALGTNLVRLFRSGSI